VGSNFMARRAALAWKDAAAVAETAEDALTAARPRVDLLRREASICGGVQSKKDMRTRITRVG